MMKLSNRRSFPTRTLATTPVIIVLAMVMALQPNFAAAYSPLDCNKAGSEECTSRADDAEAYEALALALNDSELRAEHLAPDRFSFKRRVRRGEDTYLNAQFTPTGAEGGNWQLIDPIWENASGDVLDAFDEFSDASEADRYITLSDPRSYSLDGFELAGETDELWIFRGPGIDLPGEDEEGRSFLEKAKSRLVSHLEIQKSPPQVHLLMLTNVKPIHRAPMIVIKDLSLKFEFSEAWPGGPIVHSKFEQKISGRAFFVKFRRDKIVQNSAAALADE